MNVSDPVPETLRIRLVRSPAGRKPRHRRTLAALGLHRIGQTVQQSARPEILGMVAQVSYLIAVEPAAGEDS